MTLNPPNKEQLELFTSEVNSYHIDIWREVQNLREWLKQQPHIPEYLDNDIKLRNFIIGCKFSVQRAKQTIDTYYSIRGAVPEFYTNRDPLHISVKNALEISYVIPLPALTKEGYRIILMGNKSQDLAKTVAEDFYKLVIMIAEIILMEDHIAGLYIVINSGNCTLQQLMKTTIPLIKKFMFCCQKAYPSRIKQIITFNAPSHFEYFINLVKPTLSPKLQQRYHVYSTAQGTKPLFEKVDQKIFPVDMGGEGPSIKELEDDWTKKLMSYRDWYSREENRLTNEQVRPSTTKFDYDQLFGMAGSFRKLAVD